MRSLDARWWWEAALDDWRAFEVLRREENYPPAVFHLQQAAEKALKALCYSRGLPAFTHSTVEPLRRLGDLGISVEEKLSAAARRLDPFRGLRPWERMELVLECWDGARALEPVCYTPEEFRRGRAWIVREIRRRGRRLYPRPDDRLSGPRPDPGP